MSLNDLGLGRVVECPFGIMQKGITETEGPGAYTKEGSIADTDEPASLKAVARHPNYDPTVSSYPPAAVGGCALMDVLRQQQEGDPRPTALCRQLPCGMGVALIPQDEQLPPPAP